MSEKEETGSSGFFPEEQESTVERPQYEGKAVTGLGSERRKCRLDLE
jgi:hypothetical protein